MGLFQNPTPPVFVGGAQPYAPKEGLVPQAAAGNNPPFDRRAPETFAAILAAAQPDPWVRSGLAVNAFGPYLPGRLGPALIAASRDSQQPPYNYGGPIANIANIIAQAQPDPWVKIELGPAGGLQPYAARLLSPGIPGQSVDPPPFVHPERAAVTAEIKVFWQLDPWVFDFYGPVSGRQPYGQRQLSPGIPGQSVDEPPHQYGGPYTTKTELVALWQPDPWVFTYQGAVEGLQPYGQRQLSPGVPGQSVDNPPFTQPERTVVVAEIKAIWQPDPWTYAYEGPPLGAQPYGYRQLTPPTFVHVDNPPFAHPERQAQMAAILVGIKTYWQPDPYRWTEQGSLTMSDQPYGPRWPVRAVFSPILGVGKRKPLFIEPGGGFPASYWPDGNG